MSAAAWTTIRLKAGILNGLGLPDLPFPVREEQVAGLFTRGRVHFERVLEETDRYVTEHPEVLDSYRPLLSGLAHALAVTEGAEGRTEDAVRLLRLALKYAPESERLHGDLGLALHLAGDAEEAIEAYRKAIDADGEKAFPVLRVLAARACEEHGAHQEGIQFLRGGGDELGRDPHVAGLLSRLESHVLAPPATQKQPVFCRACGEKLRQGRRFCPACGKETGVAP